MSSPTEPAGPTLLYLVYGQDRQYQHELSYSVLSAFREAGQDASGLKVLLFCDEANKRPDLPVESYVISSEEHEAWTFGGTYNHAMKIHALRRALEITRDKVCFVDTDTAFKGPPGRLFDRITETTSLMHADEGLLRDLHSWTSLLEKTERTEMADIVHPMARMYNSGLIGVTTAMSTSLEESCALMETLRRIEPVFNIEQFALGAALSRDGGIRLGEDLVDHYWGYRRHIYHGRIPAALAGLKGNHSAAASRDLPIITDPPKPLVARIRARLHGMLHGADADYRFAYLAYLASASARTSETRGIWADIALDMLKRSDRRPLARRSFGRLAPGALENSGLDYRRREAWMSFWSAT